MTNFQSKTHYPDIMTYIALLIYIYIYTPHLYIGVLHGFMHLYGLIFQLLYFSMAYNLKYI